MKPGLQVKTFFGMTVGSQIPAISLPPSICGCNFFALDDLGDHVSTCTTHSGAKKAHDWAVEQLADLFRTTHKVKFQQVAESRVERCGDIEFRGGATHMSVAEVALTLVFKGNFSTHLLLTEIDH